MLEAGCWAQVTERTPLLIRHADQMVGYETERGPVRELQGNVVLQHGTVEIRCDRARQHLLTQRAELSGNVVIAHGSLRLTMERGEYLAADRRARGEGNVVIRDSIATLRAPRGEYQLDEQQAIFRDGVELRDSSTTITSDSLAYSRRNGERRAWGHVQIHFHRDQTIVTGDSAYQFPTGQSAWVCGRSFLMRWDVSAGDTLFMRAECLDFFRDSLRQQWMRGVGNVRCIQGSLSARADSIWVADGDSIMLDGKQPIVWVDSAQLSASGRISAYLRQQSIYRITAVEKAMLGLRDDSLSIAPHQMIADSITLDFEHDSLRTVCGIGTVQTLYQHRTDEAAPDGITRVASDRIVLSFAQGKIARCTWYGSVQSEYIPEHMVTERYLHDFEWKTETKPTRHELLHINALPQQLGKE